MPFLCKSGNWERSLSTAADLRVSGDSAAGRAIEDLRADVGTDAPFFLKRVDPAGGISPATAGAGAFGEWGGPSTGGAFERIPATADNPSAIPTFDHLKIASVGPSNLDSPAIDRAGAVENFRPKPPRHNATGICG
jgi:hypothetical protein